MARVIIIDGYNVIYNWPELKSLSEISLEHARESLIERLNGYARYTGHEVQGFRAGKNSLVSESPLAAVTRSHLAFAPG